MVPLAELERLAGCKTVEQLTDIVERFMRASGFDYWIYALDLPVVDDHRRQYLLGGYPEEWVSHYFANNYLHVDPVIAHCQSHSTPLLWPAVHQQAASNDPVFKLFCEAGECGLSTGLTVPLHGLGCSWGLMSFATGQRISARDLDEMVPSLHYYAHCMHEAAHLHAHGTPPAAKRQLTARELECLRWVAAGKTSWEIGRLLCIAERTVVFHLQNVARKLDVTTRQAAVVRAIGLGLISP
jgi:DNA-binding CsgD family transcriptional regulator